MKNLGDKKYSIRFTDEELEKYSKFAEERRRPLATIIRDAMDTICDNPALLSPSTPKNAHDVIIGFMEMSAKERLDNDLHFRKDVYDNLARLHHKINFLLKKAKVPQKEIQKLNGEDISGEAIFD